MVRNLSLVLPAETPEAGAFRVIHDRIDLRTERSQQFIDLTDWAAHRLRLSGVVEGLVSVQTLHTTAGLLVNENEPLLLDDLRRALRRLAPASWRWRHDDLRIRTHNLTPDERANGHAHARAMLLPTAVTLAVRGGALALGRWQRLFLAEQDGPRERSVTLTILGVTQAG